MSEIHPPCKRQQKAEGKTGSATALHWRHSGCRTRQILRQIHKVNTDVYACEAASAQNATGGTLTCDAAACIEAPGRLTLQDIRNLDRNFDLGGYVFTIFPAETTSDGLTTCGEDRG